MNLNYNGTAFYYDQLSRLLFGKSLINAQVYLLKHISPGSRIMIVGGGTGWVLEELSMLHQSGLAITYVEMAEKMISKAMKRNVGANGVDFVCDDVKNLKTPILFDVVITPFLFDNFTQQNAEILFEHIHKFMKPAGNWLYCDFQLTGKQWQKVVLKLMLLFFKMMCNVEANHLPDIQRLFKSHRYKAAGQKTFFADFVISNVYRLPGKTGKPV